MAAKRPHLFPLWDTLVDELIERPNGKLWQPMRDLLSDDEVRGELERTSPNVRRGPTDALEEQSALFRWVLEECSDAVLR